MNKIISEEPFYKGQWRAYREDSCQCPECFRPGWGNTEKEAIDNLLEQELAAEGIKEVLRGRT